jgi:hypothetical protein
MSSTTLDNQLTMGVQPIQPLQQISQLNELFFQPPNDDNYYHVTIKPILQLSENLENNYDYEFFYARYHVTCKLLSPSLIIDILNKEIYGIDFDINDLKRKYNLTLPKFKPSSSLSTRTNFKKVRVLKSF